MPEVDGDQFDAGSPHFLPRPHGDYCFNSTLPQFLRQHVHTWNPKMETNKTGGFENIREKFGRFRILIIGRANAGKTTILRAICDTTENENPEVFDGEGKKVRAWFDIYR
jgi:hypothetical protein